MGNHWGATRETVGNMFTQPGDGAGYWTEVYIMERLCIVQSWEDKLPRASMPGV